MLVYTSQQVDPKLTGTAEIIQNIKARLATQDDNSNKVRPIPAGMNACSQYTPRWGRKIPCLSVVYRLAVVERLNASHRCRTGREQLPSASGRLIAPTEADALLRPLQVSLFRLNTVLPGP